MPPQVQLRFLSFDLVLQAGPFMLNAQLLTLEFLDDSMVAQLFALASAGVLMLKVTLDAILLVVLLLIVLADDASKLVDWEVKLSIVVDAQNGEVAADESNSVELALDFVDARTVVDDEGFIAPDWLAKGEALEHVVHELLFAPHRDHVWLQLLNHLKRHIFQSSLWSGFGAARRFASVAQSLLSSWRWEIWVQLGNAWVAKVGLPPLRDASLQVIAFAVFVVRILEGQSIF